MSLFLTPCCTSDVNPPFVIAEKIVESISVETIRQILKAHKVRLQRTKTWKECNDPKLRSKKN